jgi:hypothetical protein
MAIAYTRRPAILSLWTLIDVKTERQLAAGSRDPSPM